MYIFLSLLFALICGMVFPLQKLVIKEYTPFFSVALRFFVTAIVVLPFLKKVTKDFYKILLASLFFMVIPFASQGFAMKSLDASICALSTQISPLLLIGVGVVFFKEKVTLLQMGGVLVSVIGVYFVVQSPEISFAGLAPALALALSGPVSKKEGSADEGMVIDFGIISKILKESIHSYLDHRFLASDKDELLKKAFQGNLETQLKILFVPFIPTSENLVMFCYKKIKEKIPPLIKIVKLRLYETPKSWSEYIPS